MYSRKKIKVRDIILLQLIVIIYTLSGTSAKFASFEEFLSIRFLMFYAIEIALLGVYAILWQQMIKRIDLSIAYANRSVALFWSMIWASLIFNENISLNNIIGVLIVILGTIIINSDGNK